MNNCPCCSSTLLRHIRHSQIYWYCPHCKQEMPNFGDWLKAQAFLNTLEKHSCQAQKQVSNTSIKTRLTEQNSVQSWLIKDSNITPVRC
ncbi:hypothetical protein ACL6C3_19275 [Capilliphycus salinus ALCB114379]|uniref:hypothetical protein n=1 Tax=Capilliphycus salinus TaxID=2768948 RepID=UPI0039A45006